jgi:hypothetical protein
MSTGAVSTWIVVGLEVERARGLTLVGAERDPESGGALLPAAWLSPRDVAKCFGRDDARLAALSWLWFDGAGDFVDHAALDGAALLSVNHLATIARALQRPQVGDAHCAGARRTGSRARQVDGW